MDKSESLMEGKGIKKETLDGNQAAAMANYLECPTGAEKRR